jgi:NAD(P)H-flavin reductase/ferredoxin
MPKLHYRGQDVEASTELSVLQSLLDAGLDAPCGCKVGSCQACLLKVQPGPDISAWQNGLSADQKAQRLIYTCVAKPTEDMELVSPADQLKEANVSMTLILKEEICKDTLRIQLKADSPFGFKPGQFINLTSPCGVTRPYSIANSMASPGIELHIRCLDGGKMSEVLKTVAVGTSFDVSTAAGASVYPPSFNSKKLILVGTGTGLAPLWSITNFALKKGYLGDIYLYHGSRTRDGLYFVDRLKSLSEQRSAFHYIPCLSGEECDGFQHRRADEQALADHDDLSEAAIYLCGHPDMVAQTKKKAFLAGVALERIFADPFTISGN